MNFQDFIPPILYRSLRKVYSSKRQGQPTNFFSSYEQALEACVGAGYEDISLVETVFRKTVLCKDQMLNGKFPLSDSGAQSLLAVFLTLYTRKQTKRLKVIDFGGACGAHYFQFRSLLPSDIHIDWVVVETPEMVEKARFFETDELRFATSIGEAKQKLQSVDFLHSSGTLQYVPDPQAIIQEFASSEPAYIFLNRLILSETETMITIQESFLSANGPGTLPDGFTDKVCRYPVTYIPKQFLEDILSPDHRIKFYLADTKTSIGKKEIYTNAGLLAERSQ